MSKKPRNENKRVFVGNIPYSVSKSELREHMERAGEVVRVDLFLDEMGYSRGCGIVEYSSYLEAKRAVSIINQSRLMGRVITVKEDETYPSPRQKQPSPRSSQTQITVSNIPPSVTWQQLKDVCRELGNVLRADILVDKYGKSTGEGVVIYETLEEAMEAFRLLNGAIFNDRVVRITIED